MFEPIILLQPTGCSVLAGETGIFSGGVTGEQPVWFNWYDLIGGATGVLGETGSTLYIDNAQTANAGEYWFVAGNTGGNSADSDHVNLDVNYPATIAFDSSGYDLIVGATAAFTVGVTGTDPVWLEWYKNIGGVTGFIAGETGTTYYIPGVQESDAGTYTPVARNAYGYEEGTPATLVVGVLPTIGTDISNISVTLGNTGVFNGGATGTQPIWLNWYHDGVTGSETGPNLYIETVEESDGGDYWFIGRNGYGESPESTHATLTVDYPPYISLQPVGCSKMAGETGVFSGGATGTEPMWFNWYKNGVTGSETGPNFYILDAQSADVGSYFFIASNAFGSIQSSEQALSVNYAPHIGTRPQDITVMAGENAGFSGGATGTQPIWYAWLHDGITGSETGPNLDIPNAQSADAGSYWLEAVNAFGETASDRATLTVNYAPHIARQPVDCLVLMGETGFFGGSATGTQPIMYNWLVNGVTGTETGPNLYILNAQSTDEGTYQFEAVSAYGSTGSDRVTLTVICPPVIDRDLADQWVMQGDTGTFVGGVTGHGPMWFNWYSNIAGVTGILGETGSTLIIEDVREEVQGDYWYVAGNTGGTAESTHAVLTVDELPYITQQPSSHGYSVGETGLLIGGATGTQPIWFNWYYNLVTGGITGMITGETGATVYLDDLQVIDTGAYYFIARNIRGSSPASAHAHISVEEPLQDIDGGIYIQDFRGVPRTLAMYTGMQKVEMTYDAFGNPGLTGVAMTTMEYTVDGITWHDMTPSTDSGVTGLSFGETGIRQSFRWEVLTDLARTFYNQSIRVRMKFESGVMESDYMDFIMLISKTVTDMSAATNPVGFPEDYKGIPGSDLMKNAPKVQG